MKPPPIFSIPDGRAMLTALLAIEPSGRPIRVQDTSCALCRRRVSTLGVLVQPPFIVCPSTCDVVPIGKVRAIFESPYGSSLSRTFAASFARTLQSGSRMWMDIASLRARGEVLVQAHIRLLRLQAALDAVERFRHPADYREGRIHIVPPRALSDIVLLRSDGRFSWLDPLEGADDDLKLQVQTVLREGAAALQTPF